MTFWFTCLGKVPKSRYMSVLGLGLKHEVWKTSYSTVENKSRPEIETINKYCPGKSENIAKAVSLTSS